MELTHHQRMVAQHTEGHALCIAVAGSGKTSTLACLIQNLLHQGANPVRMMVMMFNKSAQRDFTQKLHRLEAHNPVPEVRTYHATGLRLLKNLERWGLRSPYDHHPLSEKETELKVKELIEKLCPDTLKDRVKSDPAKYIEAVISFIDSVKSHLSSPEVIFERQGFPDSFRFFQIVFHEFEQWRHNHRRITFTDMLYDTVCLIQQHPEVIERITNKMDFIIVDEYQDTSTLQHRLTRIIAGERARVIAVGDPDQTIYEFAGANIENILQHFEEDFSDTSPVERHTLPHTFRYGHSIALAASHLISQNKARKDVICLAHPDNPASDIRLTQTDSNETGAILHQVRQYLSSSEDPIAILVRVWAQAVPIELNLLAEGIEYSCDGPSLFDRPEVAAIIAALELAGGQFPLMDVQERSERLFKLFTLPHLGIKNGLIQSLVQQLQPHDQSFGQHLAHCTESMAGLSDYQRKKLFSRAKVLQYLERQGSKETPVTLLEHYIRRTELKESLESMSLNDQRTEEQLLAIDGFLSYLRQLNLDTAASCYHIEDLKQARKERKHPQSAQSRLTLSSCHKAKGLEWSTVLIPGLTTKYWPFNRDDALAQSSANELESERRLLYVAMTRARRTLHLFSCKGDLDQRTHNWSDQGTRVSRFLQEMQLKQVKAIAPALYEDSSVDLETILQQQGVTKQTRRYLMEVRPDLAELIQSAPSRSSAVRDQQKSRTETRSNYYAARKTILSSQQQPVSANDPWRLNARIRHSIFGEGKVIEVNDTNFIILFAGHHGVKRFARNDQVRHLFEVL